MGQTPGAEESPKTRLTWHNNSLASLIREKDSKVGQPLEAIDEAKGYVSWLVSLV